MSNETPENAEVPKEEQPLDSGTEAKIEELKAAAQKAQNDYLYLRAEFENYKKNMIKERSELMKYGNERILVEILNVLDNVDRALKSDLSQDNLQTFKKGVELIAAELKNLTTKFGVTEVPSENVRFNPEIHEALGSEESEDISPGNVVRVYKKPYKLHDRVIRPGQVIVAKEKKD